MYLRLNNLTFFVKGNQSILYNIHNKNIIILDEISRLFIEHCENNYLVENFPSYAFLRNQIVEFISEMQNLDMVILTKEKIHIEKYRYRSPVEGIGFLAPPPVINSVYIQKNQSCDKSCEFCGNKNYKIWMGCESCIDVSKKQHEISLPPIVEFINKARPREVIIRGGNPFKDREKLRLLFDRISCNIGIAVSIDIVEKDNISYLKEIYGGRIFFNMIFINDEDLSKEQEYLLEYLRESQIPYYITLYANCRNKIHILQKKDIIEKQFNVSVAICEILDTRKDEQVLHITNEEKPVFMYQDARVFFDRQSNNSCLNGKVAIDICGNILPCPMINVPIGNIYNQSYEEIIGNGKLFDFWKLTKEKIEHCKNCGMRFHCSDCSVFEMFTDPDKWCPHNKNKSLMDIDFKNSNISKSIFI